MKGPVRLDRQLTPISLALFGLSYICPTAIFSTFGFLQQDAHGATAAAYLTATVAILFTAFSYGRMAARFPQAGSAYTYVSKTVNSSAGSVIGWVLILDYAVVPMAICLFTAKAIEVIVPGVSYRIWVAVIAVATTAVNALGIKVTDRVNLAIMVVQVGVIVALIILCIHFLIAGPDPLGVWTAAPFVNPDTTIASVMAGAAIAAYSFLGFDAVTTLSEEAIDPTSSIPKAALFAAGASGFIYVVASFLMTLVHPSASYHDTDNAGYEILALLTGRAFSLTFLAVIIAWVASVMCAQAGSSRLLYTMGRDGVLPDVFAYLHPALKTPMFNIGVMGLVMLAGEWVPVETAASCVNFGAFIAFTAVNLGVIADHWGGTRQLGGGTFKLVQAGIGATTTIWLLASLHKPALIVGSLWLLAGVAYLGLQRRLK